MLYLNKHKRGYFMEKDKNTEEELVKQFDPKKTGSDSMMKVVIVIGVVAVLGIGSGFVIAKGTVKNLSATTQVTNSSEVKSGTALGTNDTKTFPDSVEGTLKKGGIDGEGQYHLERPGGPTQFVYLTSSVVDLSLVEGRKVKVWGQTQKAQHAPWLMDVGRVEVQ